MKKLIWLLILFITSSAASASDIQKKESFFKEYRHYPFQWILPEYYYTPKFIKIKKDQNFKKRNLSFFGLKAFLPYKFNKEKKGSYLVFKSSSGEKLIVSKSKNSSILCTKKENEISKDFCSSFKTPQEYFHKLFTLTPDLVKNTGEKWIVHTKGSVFQDVNNISIFSASNFNAYVRSMKESTIQEKNYSHEIILFHDNLPEHYIVIILKVNNKEDAKNFIFSLK